MASEKYLPISPAFRLGRVQLGGGILALAMFLGCLPGRAQADDAQLLSLLKTFVDEFVSITPGEGDFPERFEQGSAAGTGQDVERPAHTVRMKQPFAIAKYEVPQNLYEAVMGANPSRWKGPRNSVEMVSWHDAQRFCAKLTILLRDQNLISRLDSIELPTESQWEYCCRAGTTADYSFGAQAQLPTDKNPKASLLDPYGWHTGNAAGNDPPVGSLKPNPWGLYDMHGYLWEYVADDWHADYTDAPTDGAEWSIRPRPAEQQVVIRGGSWKDLYADCRSASRRAWPANRGAEHIGLRCVRIRNSKH